MFNFKENGKDLIYLTTNEAISCYLVSRDTFWISHKNLEKYGKFLEENLTNEERVIRVICGEEAIQEIARDQMFFDVTDEMCSLRPTCEMEDLGELLTYIPESFFAEIKEVTTRYTSLEDEEEEENEG